MATNTETAQPTQAPTAAPVAEPVKTQTVKQVVAAQVGFADKIAKLKAEGTVAEKALIHQLEGYVQKMTPGLPVKGDQGALNQYSLYRTLLSTVNNGGQEFTALWNIVLAFFAEYQKGVFGSDYLFRFTEFWVKPQEELHAFLRLANIASLTADPKTRSTGIKQIDFHRSMEFGVESDGRQNLLRFYGV